MCWERGTKAATSQPHALLLKVRRAFFVADDGHVAGPDCERLPTRHQAFTNISKFAYAGMLSHKHEPGRPTPGCCEVSLECCNQQAEDVLPAHSRLGSSSWRRETQLGNSSCDVIVPCLTEGWLDYSSGSESSRLVGRAWSGETNRKIVHGFSK